MELHAGETVLFVESNEDNLKVRNLAETSDSKGLFLCKLSDFFCNNISYEVNSITVLQLDNCDISEIPNSIQRLNLKQLILTRNKLREIPGCLYSGLKSLELLDLSHNFIGNFDIEPACSCTIEILKLGHNLIQNVPYWILHLRCPKLIEIDYSGNYIKKDFKVSHELNIKRLEMRNSQLVDVDFDFLKGIKTLEFLDISNNKSGKNENLFKNIDSLFNKFKWRQLHTLKLSNLILSIIPKKIFTILSITELHLANCELNWIPEEITDLINLEVIDISENSICSFPKNFTSLKNLSVIKAQFNLISLLTEFDNDLEILDLYGNQLEIFPHFIDRIKFIDLEKNYFDTSGHESYENYKTKRDNLRKRFDYDRSDGAVISEETYESDDHHSISSEESDQSAIDTPYNISLENECWDDEKHADVVLTRNPEVTTSDEEWDGRQEIKVKKKKRNLFKPWFDENEDWIFCDAD